MLAASLRQDYLQAYNLGFVSTAYTAAHEAMELLLKLYLIRGPRALPREEAWGHDLGKLFAKWDEPGRVKAELTYQRAVLNELNVNRVHQASSQATLNLGPNGELPPDYDQRNTVYNKAYRQYRVKLLHEGNPTVRDVVVKLDAALGAKNIKQLCKPTHAGEIKGSTYSPEVWYPEELLSKEWNLVAKANQQGQPLGFVETFLKREGAGPVFVGWRYLDEMILEQKNITFHGPPAKMILMAQHLSSVVLQGLDRGSNGQS